MTGLEPILVSVVVLAAPLVFVITATVNVLKTWFQSKGELKAEDKEVIAFSIRERLATGGYATQTGVFSGGEKIVQGFYDKRTDQVTAARRIRAARLDATLQAVHSQPLVVWE
jgi:hypothetical protein